MSADWKSKVGASTAVEWPVGMAPKATRVSPNNVQNTKGSIGYVEYAYAKQVKANTVQHDQQGWPNGRTQFDIVPGCCRERQMGQGQSGFHAFHSYRISPAPPSGRLRARLVRSHPQAAEGTGRGKRGAEFFASGLCQGQQNGGGADYVPLPKNVTAEIEKVWATEIKDASGNSLYGMAR